MQGYFHIFRRGLREELDNLRVPEYQADYAAFGKVYSRTLQEPELIDFLREEIAMDSATLTRTVDTLRSSGQVTIGDVELGEAEIPALGFTQVPSQI